MPTRSGDGIAMSTSGGPASQFRVQPPAGASWLQPETSRTRREEASRLRMGSFGARPSLWSSRTRKGRHPEMPPVCPERHRRASAEPMMGLLHDGAGDGGEREAERERVLVLVLLARGVHGG